MIVLFGVKPRTTDVVSTGGLCVRHCVT